MSGTVGVSPNMKSGVVGKYPVGHVLQVTAMAPNRTNATSTGSEAVSACAHGITVTAGNDILLTATTPYRITSPGSAVNYAAIQMNLKHSTAVDGTFALVSGSPTGGIFQRAYFDNMDGTNVPANFYNDGTIAWNYLDKSVSGTTHFYKIFFTGELGTHQISYDETYSTMTLTEIQT